MTRQARTTPYNSTYPKVAVQWLNQTLCFYQSFCLVYSEVLRNRHLRVAAKRYKQPISQNMTDRNSLRLKKPARATANFGTSAFCQPQEATAKNSKEPKFTNRTPTPKLVRWLDSYSTFFRPP